MVMLRKNNSLFFWVSVTLTQELTVTSYRLQLTRCCLIPHSLRVRIILSISKSVWGDTVNFTNCDRQ